MPFFEPSDETLPRLPTAVQPANPLRPTSDDVLMAAFRQDNPVVNVFRSLSQERFPAEPDHNPMDLIRGTKFEQSHLDNFLGSRSADETRAIMRRIDEEDADRRTLDAAGIPGTVAQVAAGMIDPTIALPAGQIVRGARGGYSIIRSAALTGAAAGLQTGIQEGILQSTQETRTAAESATAIGSATLLGAFLGGGAAALFSREEAAALAKSLDATRAEMDAHAGNVVPFPEKPPAPESASPGLAASAGAAATDTRELTMPRTGLEFSAGLSPTRRVLSADAVTARRTMADLAETPYRFDDNNVGVATTQGPPVDRIVRNEINGTHVRVADEMDRLWGDLRFGEGNTPYFAKMRDTVGMLGREDGMPMFGDFKEMVSDALMSGDRHEIPQVAQAAQFIRREVFDKWAPRAEKVIEGFKPMTPREGESYFPHLWNKEIIRARRPEFANKLTGLYRDDQTKKAAAKERITAAHQSLGVEENLINKYQARIESLSSDAEVVAARQEEATRLNKFAFERSTDLRESQFRNEGGIRVDAPGKNIDKARGGAVFETKVRERGNTLSDQVSAKLAEIDATERKLARSIQNHNDLRARIEKEIADWDGKSAQEAKTAMKSREEWDAERAAKAVANGEEAPKNRLGSADSAVDRTVKRIIESDRDLSIDELRARANETVDRILGSPDGRLPYDMHMGGPRIGSISTEAPRGSMNARQLDVSNAWAKDWIETDAEQIAAMHLRTFAPDVVLAERFGDVEMTPAFRAIKEEYAAKIDATKSEKERTKLGKERDAVIRDLAAVRDRVRGVYGWSADLRNLARVANGAKTFNNLSSMGVAAVSSLPDFAGAIFRYGFSGALQDGWAPYFKYMTGQLPEFEKFKTQMRSLGIGIEVTTNARQHALDDVMDVYRPQSRFERGLQATSDKFFIANLLAPLTDAQKTIAAHVSTSEMLRAAKASSEGKATQKQIANLAESGVDQQMAERIWRNFSENGGVSEGGVHLPNTADWKDKAAAQALEGAISREVDIMVVTPGQEKALWMSKPVLSLLGQFKAFTAASTERILIANLQRRDASSLSGAIAAIGLGMMSYKVNSMLGGSKTSDRPQDWLKEGIGRGGMLGWFEEGNALASKATRGQADIYRMIGADKPLSRYASRSTLDMLLGPTAGKIPALSSITGAAASGEWNESDTKSVRRLMAFQNLLYVRGLFNQVEKGVNGTFGIEMKPQP